MDKLPAELQFDPEKYAANLNALNERNDARRLQMKIIAVASAFFCLASYFVALGTSPVGRFAAYGVIGSIPVPVIALAVSLVALGVLIVAYKVAKRYKPVVDQYEVPNGSKGQKKGVDRWSDVDNGRIYVRLCASGHTERAETKEGAQFAIVTRLLMENEYYIPNLYLGGRWGTTKVNYGEMSEGTKAFLMNFGKIVAGNNYLEEANFFRVIFGPEKFLEFLKQFERPLPLRTLVLPVFTLENPEGFAEAVCKSIRTIISHNPQLKTLGTPSSFIGRLPEGVGLDLKELMNEISNGGESSLEIFSFAEFLWQKQVAAN